MGQIPPGSEEETSEFTAFTPLQSEMFGLYKRVWDDGNSNFPFFSLLGVSERSVNLQGFTSSSQQPQHADFTETPLASNPSDSIAVMQQD